MNESAVALSFPTVLVVLDWDETMTDHSTIAEIALVVDETKRGEFDHCVVSYAEEYAAHVNNRPASPTISNTLADELSWLDSFTLVEEASIFRLERAGLWSGLISSRLEGEQAELILPRRNGVDIELRARDMARERRVTFRPGLREFLEQVQRTDRHSAAVVSVAWSGLWISYMMQMALFEHTGPCCMSVQQLPPIPPSENSERAGDQLVSIASKNASRSLLIYANEIDPSGSGCLSRGLPGGHRCLGSEIKERPFNFRAQGRGLWTASDKGIVFKRAVTEFTESEMRRSQDTLGTDIRTVYIGDSATDLACLFDADIGIIMQGGSSESLLQALRRLDVVIRPLSEASHNNLWSSDKDQKRLWSAYDFHSIRKAIYPAVL